MDKVSAYLRRLIAANGTGVPESRKLLFEEFCMATQNHNAITKIFEFEDMLKKNWELHQRIDDIQKQSFMLPNASMGKYYEYRLDFDLLNLHDIIELKFTGLEEIGLEYNDEDKIIKGKPAKSGDINLQVEFTLSGYDEPEQRYHKSILLIINPDPKSLWKDLPSNREDRFWKEDNVEVSGRFLDKNIVISSKRGRSHANIGLARDDHFAYKNFEESGWSIIAVSDGAGSAKYSRQGSKIACESVITYFSEKLDEPAFLSFGKLLKAYNDAGRDKLSPELKRFIYDTIGNSAFQAYKKLESAANEMEISINDLHSTLIFCLVKKYDADYVVLSFSVGDCPMAVLNTNIDDVCLLNQLDVGEYGGGTRFITMPEIFDPVKLQSRFGFKVFQDFSYLMLMTDGIYDPKFVTESNLENIEKWKSFLADLDGHNADGTKVNFNGENPGIAGELSEWMNFWDSGNHDDRTLAIIY